MDYGFAPPVICLPVLKVIYGGSDVHLRPLLINSITEKNQFFEFENRFL